MSIVTTTSHELPEPELSDQDFVRAMIRLLGGVVEVDKLHVFVHLLAPRGFHWKNKSHIFFGTFAEAREVISEGVWPCYDDCYFWRKR